MSGIGPITGPPPYVSYVRAMRAVPGLVGYWPMGETTGTVLRDAMGIYDGVYDAAPSLGQTGLLRAGDPSKSVLFNGSTQDGYVARTLGGHFDFGDAFSLFAWFDYTTVAGAYHSLLCKGANGYQLQISNANKLALVRSGVQQLCDSGSALSAGIHFVVGTKNGASIHLYLDGADVTANVVNSACVDTAVNLYFGQNGAGGEFFPGRLAHMAVAAGAVDPSVPAALWRIGNGG